MRNIWALIAEVSGFADMFMILGVFLVGIFNRARMQSSMAKLMGPLENPGGKKPPRDKPRPVRLLAKLLSYRALKESLVHSLYTAWCPRNLLNRRQRKIERLKRKQLERAECGLDIRNVVKSQEDLCVLLRLLMTRE